MIGRVCHLLRMQAPVVDNRGLLYLSGATVPTDGTDGYQTGCLFQHTDGGANTALFVNEGTVAACSFRAVEVGTDVAGESEAIEFADDQTGPLISIDTTDPTGDSYTTPFLITGQYSSTCALALQLSATNQRPVTFVFDDGGEILGSGNYRAVLSRVMLCSTQTGQVAIRAIRGQIKVADGLTINIATNEMNAINGVEGYIELAGTTARTIGANTRVAAVHGLVEVRQDITLTAGGYVAGLFAELCQTTAKAVDGVGTMGVLVDRLDSDHTDAQAQWTYGIFVDGSAVKCGISVGKYASSYATGSAVVMSATTHTAAAAFFGETVAALGAGYMTRAVRGRHLINTDDDVNQETYGVQGQLCVKGATTTTLKHLHAGVLGTLEVLSGVTLDTSGLGYDYAHAGVIARVGGLAAGITATDPLCGFLAFWNDQAGTTLANSVGLAIYAPAAYSSKWGTGIIIDGRSVTTGIQVGSTSDGLGVILSATVTKAVGIYAELEACAGSAANVRPLRSRLRVDASGNVESETYGMQGQLNAYASTNLGHWHAGVLGTLEGSAATVRVYNPLAGAAGVIGRVGGDITIDTAGWLAGVIALANCQVTATSGNYVGFYATKSDLAGAEDWTYGVYIEDAELGMFIKWATTSTDGTGADPIYGDGTTDGGVQGCISVGTTVTAATVAGIGSHAAFVSNLTLSVALEEFSLFGGTLSVCTVAVAQSQLASVVAGVTGYIRNVKGSASIVKSDLFAVRGMVYTASDGEETWSQAALHGAIYDRGAHATANNVIVGLHLDLKVTTALGAGGNFDAIYIQTVDSTVDLGSIINVQEDNVTFFARFNTNGGDASACKPAQVVTSTITGSGATCDALVKIEIDDTAYYIAAWTADHVTGESA